MPFATSRFAWITHRQSLSCERYFAIAAIVSPLALFVMLTLKTRSLAVPSVIDAVGDQVHAVDMSPGSTTNLRPSRSTTISPSFSTSNNVAFSGTPILPIAKFLLRRVARPPLTDCSLTSSPHFLNVIFVGHGRAHSSLRMRGGCRASPRLFARRTYRI